MHILSMAPVPVDNWGTVSSAAAVLRAGGTGRTSRVSLILRDVISPQPGRIS
jgi:hypothetical protein